MFSFTFQISVKSFKESYGAIYLNICKQIYGMITFLGSSVKV